jgi:hypothetical protein
MVLIVLADRARGVLHIAFLRVVLFVLFDGVLGVQRSDWGSDRGARGALLQVRAVLFVLFDGVRGVQRSD